jgi:MRG-binding protein
MHKHFRMIALHNYLHSTGCTSPSDAHTRIPGIWDKLSQLYNLPILDEREDTFLPSPPDDPTGSALYHPFSLPEAEYGNLMFERRLALSPSTPAISERGAGSRLASTIEDTDEPRSSPAPKKTGRGGGRGTKKSKLQEEAEASVGEGEGDEEMDDAAEGEGEEEDEDEEETENAEGEDGEEETKAASSKAKRGKGRGGRGSRRKTKGR